jgi:hypothetical protein
VVLISGLVMSGAACADDDLSASDRRQFCEHFAALFGPGADVQNMPEPSRVAHVRGLLAVAPDRLDDEIRGMDPRGFGPRSRSGAEAERDLRRIRDFGQDTCTK